MTVGILLDGFPVIEGIFKLLYCFLTLLLHLKIFDYFISVFDAIPIFSQTFCGPIPLF